MRSRVFLVIVAVLLAGCPPIFPELERTARIAEMPDLSCIAERLKKFFGETAVSSRVSTHQNVTFHVVGYSIAEKQYYFMIADGNDDLISIHHGVAIGGFSAEDVWSSRILLRQTEFQIRNQCGLGAVMDKAKETCKGRNCAGVA